MFLLQKIVPNITKQVVITQNGRPHRVTLSWAKENGYGACKYCYQLEEDNSYVWITITIVVSIFMTLLLAFGFKEYYKNKHIDVNNYNIKQ